MNNKIKWVVTMLNAIANVLLAFAGFIGAVYALYEFLVPNKGENEA